MKGATLLCSLMAKTVVASATVAGGGCSRNSNYDTDARKEQREVAAHFVCFERQLRAEVRVIPEAQTDEAEELNVVRLVAVEQRRGGSHIGGPMSFSHFNCLSVRIFLLVAIAHLFRSHIQQLSKER